MAQRDRTPYELVFFSVLLIVGAIFASVGAAEDVLEEDVLGNEYSAIKYVHLGHGIDKGTYFVVSRVFEGRCELTLVNKTDSAHSFSQFYVGIDEFRGALNGYLKLERKMAEQERELLRSNDAQWNTFWDRLAKNADEHWRHEAEREQRKVMVKKKAAAAAYQEKVRRGGVISFTWNGRGAAVIESITISNTGTSECRDVNGVISFVANSGTILGSRKFTIYDVIPAGKVRTFKGINVGIAPDQAHRAHVKILDCK